MSPAARDSSSDFRALPTASIPLALSPTSRAHADRSARNGGNDLAQAHDRAADEERAACRADQSTDEQNDGEQDRVPDAPVRPCLRRFHFVMVGRLRWRSITLATSRRYVIGRPDRLLWDFSWFRLTRMGVRSYNGVLPHKTITSPMDITTLVRFSGRYARAQRTALSRRARPRAGRSL